MPKTSKIVTFGVLFFYSASNFCQVQECERMYLEAKKSAKSAKYELAIRKLMAAKICSPQETKYDSLILAIYREVNKAKEVEQEAKIQAEQALEREIIAKNDAVKQKEVVQKQFAKSYWRQSKLAREGCDFIESLLLAAEAVTIGKSNKDFVESLYIDLNEYLSRTFLKRLFIFNEEIRYGHFNADGSLLMVFGDHTIYLYNIETRQLQSTFQTSDPIYTAFFSKDEKEINIATSNLIKKWNYTTSKCIDSTETNASSPITISPDKKRFFSVKSDSVYVYGIEDSSLLTVKKHRHRDRPLFSPDGTVLRTHDGRIIQFWNLETGDLISSIAVDAEFSFFSPSGKHLVTVGKHLLVSLWEVSTAQNLIKENQYVTGVYFSPDGRTFLSKEHDSNLILYNLESNEKQNFEVKETIYFAEYSPDNRFLSISGNFEGKGIIRLLDVESSKFVASFEHPCETVEPFFSPSGKMLATICENSVYIWDVSRANEHTNLPRSIKNIMDVKYTSDAKRVITTYDDNLVRIYDTDTWFCVDSLQNVNTDFIVQVLLHPDDRRILTLSGGEFLHNLGNLGENKVIRIWDTKTKLEAFTFLHDDYPRNAKFSPDGKTLLTEVLDTLSRTRNGQFENLVLWDLNTKKIIESFPGNFEDAFFNNDNQTLTTRFNGKIYMRDTKSGRVVRNLELAQEYVEGLLFRPDGKHFAVWSRAEDSQDKRLYIYDTDKWRKTYTFSKYDFRQTAWYTPNSKYLVTLTDRKITFYDAETLKSIGSITVAEDIGHVSDVKFTPNGRFLIVIGWLIEVWDIEERQRLISTLERQLLHEPVVSPASNEVILKDYDEEINVWNITPGDLDISPELFKLQAQVITSSQFNPLNGEIVAISPEKWIVLEKEYWQKAKAHAKVCKYLDFNVWHKLFKTSKD